MDLRMNSIENQVFGGYRNLPILPPSEVIRPPKGCIEAQEINTVVGGNVFVMHIFDIVVSVLDFLYKNNGSKSPKSGGNQKHGNHWSIYSKSTGVVSTIPKCNLMASEPSRSPIWQVSTPKPMCEC